MAKIKIADTRKAFGTKLQALYYIEKSLEKALPKMQKAARDTELKDGFHTHLAETKEQRKRLERAFKLMEMKPKALTCEAMRGLIKDGDWVAKVDAPQGVHDAMLAAAARYVEHYEMAGYLSAIAEAQALGESEIVVLLQETLAEETADQKLAAAASKNLNQ